MNRYRVIIAGGRDFNDFERMVDFCDYYLQNKTSIEIVSGKAKGADSLGEQYAKLRGYPIVEYPADWNKLGKAAGPIRNKEMAKYADALLAFWDGRSKGTKNMLQLAYKHNLDVRLCAYDAKY